MKPPNHGLLHRVTITDETDGTEIEFEGYLVLDHPGAPFTGLKLIPDQLLIDATDRIEVVR